MTAFDRKKPTTSKKIGILVWKQGDLVVARTKKTVFEATVVGFKTNCAIVTPIGSSERFAINYRNLIDPRTNEPLKKTTKEEAISGNGNYLTAYIPTPREKRAWEKEMAKRRKWSRSKKEA